jgi:glycosyltransferase involved in cell wall biosynthesis
MGDPSISICIPAYRRTAYLERLLDSIVAQDLSPAEIVLTDDSPDDSVRDLASRYQDKLPLRYFKNPQALGTPENWNEAIRLSTGSWIKVMHDDDWFEGPSSLRTFARAVGDNPGVDFIFSAYRNVHEDTGEVTPVRLSSLGRRLLSRSPWYLLGENYIGNPSCTLFRKKGQIIFDPSFKWVVDFEFYIRYLEANPGYTYVDEILVNVGINATQVTNYTFGVAAVQMPENHRLLEKNGWKPLRRLVVYDYFWRLYRNLGIRAPQDQPLPPVLESMIRWQSGIPSSLLEWGPASKSLMFLHYLTHYSNI